MVLPPPSGLPDLRAAAIIPSGWFGPGGAGASPALSRPRGGSWRRPEPIRTSTPPPRTWWRDHGSYTAGDLAHAVLLGTQERDPLWLGKRQIPAREPGRD